MHQPLIQMLFPVFGAHVSNFEFMYPDYKCKESCGEMSNLVADSGCNKGQFGSLVATINRNFLSICLINLDNLDFHVSADFSCRNTFSGKCPTIV